MWISKKKYDLLLRWMDVLEEIVGVNLSKMMIADCPIYDAIRYTSSGLIEETKDIREYLGVIYQDEQRKLVDASKVKK